MATEKQFTTWECERTIGHCWFDDGSKSSLQTPDGTMRRCRHCRLEQIFRIRSAWENCVPGTDVAEERGEAAS